MSNLTALKAKARKEYEKFDWSDCGNFEVKGDGTVRDCYLCGFRTQWCGNCLKDHHIDNKNDAIKAFLDSQIEEAYEKGKTDGIYKIIEARNKKKI